MSTGMSTGRGRGKKKRGRSSIPKPSQDDAEGTQPTQGSSRKDHEQMDSAVQEEKVVVLSTTPPAGGTLPDQKKGQATKLVMKLEVKKVVVPGSTMSPAEGTLPDQPLGDMKLEAKKIICEATELGIREDLVPFFMYSELKKKQTQALEIIKFEQELQKVKEQSEQDLQKEKEQHKFEQDLQKEKEQHKFEQDLQKVKEQHKFKMQELETHSYQNQCLLKYQFAALGQRYLLECLFHDAKPLLVKQGANQRDMTIMTKVCIAVRQHWTFFGSQFGINGPFPHINGALLYGSLSDRLHIPYSGAIYVSNGEDKNVVSFFKQLAQRYHFQEGLEIINESAAHAAEQSHFSL